MSKFALYADEGALQAVTPAAIRESVRFTTAAAPLSFVLVVLLSGALAMVAGSVILALQA